MSSLTMLELTDASVGSEKIMMVSMPVSWRLTSAMSRSYSKSLMLLTPLSRKSAPICCA